MKYEYKTRRNINATRNAPRPLADPMFIHMENSRKFTKSHLSVVHLSFGARGHRDIGLAMSISTHGLWRKPLIQIFFRDLDVPLVSGAVLRNDSYLKLFKFFYIY